MQTARSSFDPRDFRRALGTFATGVTIVTARAQDGTPVGITANSFNSVSLEPPMVLWSLANTARTREVFSTSTHWNVHILSNAQEHLSDRFARAGEDKFAGLALDESAFGAPLLKDCSARFQCRSAFQYEGGDHTIFVGEVLAYDSCALPPLLYLTGEYALASRRAAPVSTEPQADLAGASYSEDLLGYLLGRAHFQFMHHLRPALLAYQLSDADFFVLSLLSVRSPLSQADMAAYLSYTGVHFDAAMCQAMLARQLLTAAPEEAGRADRWQATAHGRQAIAAVLALATQAEDALVARLGEIEAAALRNLLKHLILATDPGLPKLWRSPSAP